MKNLSIRALVLACALVAPATQAGVVLRDDFSNPATGWPNHAATRDSDLGFAVYTDTGKYQLTPVHDEVFGFMPAPRQATGGDVRIEADMFLYAGIGAGAGGVGCRFKDHRNFYAFMARGDAVVAIVKVKDGVIVPLANGRVSQVMAGAVDTHLVAECRGSELRLSAKGGGSLVANDSDFTSGSSGVFVVGEKLAGTSVTFDDVVLSDFAGQ